MNSKIILKKNEDRRVREGHLWVFSNEVEITEDSVENGDIVDIYDSQQEFIGTGFYNKNSLIACRLLNNTAIDDFHSFIKDRIMKAYRLRQGFYPGEESYRLVFSESDFLPGLIIDKYNQTFVLQINSYGMQRNVQTIVEVLKNELNAKSIFSKNEKSFRRMEGLPEEDTIYLGSMDKEIITVGSIKYEIDFEKGHKTGFYFDQRDNRIFVEKITKGKNVIDAFSNSGGFGMHAAKAGASSVKFVDSSSFAIEAAKQNCTMNNIDNNFEFIVSPVYDYFEKLLSEKQLFDVIMIDPPAFAKKFKDIPAAKKGYEKLNKISLQLINDEGYLVTSSCSYHLDKEDFLEVVSRAATKAGKKIQLIHFNQASFDHPKLPAMNETAYLKFAVFRVIR